MDYIYIDIHNRSDAERRWDMQKNLVKQKWVVPRVAA
jgi:hypothetical protein